MTNFQYPKRNVWVIGHLGEEIGSDGTDFSHCEFGIYLGLEFGDFLWSH